MIRGTRARTQLLRLGLAAGTRRIENHRVEAGELRRQ